MTALFVKCNVCEKQFNPHHFNSKCCSDKCREEAKKIARKKYKKSEKGRMSEERYMNGEAYKEKEKRYRTKPESRALSVERSKRCLSRNVHLQEAKKKRDIEYSRTEKGRNINKIASAKYRKTDKGIQSRKDSKSRRRSVEKSGKVSLIQWRGILKRYKNKCAICGLMGEMEMDHIYPLSKGGLHCVSNIQPLCRSCNASKGAKIYGW